MIVSWCETSLPTLLFQYKLEDIYTADAFGPFYQCLPNKTFHLKSEKSSGGKHSKIRITGVAAADPVGDKLTMFVIGKSKNHRCFESVKSPPCRCKSQRKSWMDNVLFEECVRSLDRKLVKENKKNCVNNRQLSSASKNWQSFQCSPNIFISKHHVCHSANGSRSHKVLKGSLL